jgi:hypothetical protein
MQNWQQCLTCTIRRSSAAERFDSKVWCLVEQLLQVLELVIAAFYSCTNATHTYLLECCYLIHTPTPYLGLGNQKATICPAKLPVEEDDDPFAVGIVV